MALHPISRKDAKAAGLKRYFTGKPCPKGHVCERRINNKSCVECIKENFHKGQRQRRLNNLHHYRNTEREQQKRWRLNNPDRYAERRRKIKKQRPERTYAHNVLSSAVRHGKLKRLPCQVCGSLKTEAHHPDYSKPLEVVWLCQPHHQEEHSPQKG